MVHFIGAGPGAADLITIRGAEYLRRADVVIYAGSLVNAELLSLTKPGCEIHNSASMTLEEVLHVMETAECAGQTTVRLHSGDPSLYGAVREQFDALDARGILWDITPGVSSWNAAAASLGVEYTLPGISQSVIVTRLGGRTGGVPDRENLHALASHGTSMVIFLSASMLGDVQRALLDSKGYTPDTPSAIVYKASWPDEQILYCTVGTLAQTGERAGVHKTALILTGDFLRGPDSHDSRSQLYHPSFSTEYRKGSS